MTELRWCFGEYCRGPQPPENFRRRNGRQCWTCYKAEELNRSRERKRRARRNPVVLARIRAQALEYWHRKNTPERLAELRSRRKIRYGKDPEFRERMLNYSRKWRAKVTPPTFQCWGISRVTRKRCTRMSYSRDGCQWHRQSQREAAA